MTRLGVIVPCRDEEAVIERKLANLARADWPEGRHRVVVVDDGSRDGTAERASRVGVENDRVQVTVTSNQHSPGKAGAMRTGLDALGDEVDLIVLTDADVVVRREALVNLTAAFARNAALGMACGAQEFVSELPTDGTERGRDGGPLRPAGETYDLATARVRALESRWGKLFSVHGQLLAWRRELGLVPAPGIAADDLDLMLQVRERGLRVERIVGARFLEVKTPAGERREHQALRRARAYFQVLAPERSLPGLTDRLQLAFYRFVPRAAPELALLVALVAVAAGWLVGGPVASAGVALLLLGVAASRRGREVRELLGVIRAARRDGDAAELSDRWEMQRT